MDVTTIGIIVGAIVQGAQDILGKIGVVMSKTLVIVITVLACIGVTIFKAVESHLPVFSLGVIIVLVQVLIGAVGGNVVAHKGLKAVGLHG